MIDSTGWKTQHLVTFILSLVALIVFSYVYLCLRQKGRSVPVSVNYHFTRRCNKSCGFCFHTATTSHILSNKDAKRGLAKLKHAGMKKKKNQFRRREPFMYRHFLGEVVEYCKEQLHLETVSIITNGSLVKKEFLKQYGSYIDILAVSCDSFNERPTSQSAGAMASRSRNRSKLPAGARNLA